MKKMTSSITHVLFSSLRIISQMRNLVLPPHPVNIT